MVRHREKVAFDYELLRIRIKAKYGSETKFAEKIGVKKEYLSRKLNNNIQLTITDVIEWSGLLDIPESLIGVYFFHPKSTDDKE